jgi:SAM-dependent methyltransferase
MGKRKRRAEQAWHVLLSVGGRQPVAAEPTRAILMIAIPDRNTFESFYATGAPWDVGKPQKAFVDVADRIRGSVLDAGCGTGDTALFFASRGNTVTGIDYLDEPIRRAKLKVAQQKLNLTFLVKDAMTLKDWNERFDNAIDNGLFHCFSDEDRQIYVDGLSTVVKAGGRVWLMCFSDAEPGTDGPRRISKRDIEEAFARGWEIESIEPSRFETRPDLKDLTFSPGGPKTWFAIIRREV